LLKVYKTEINPTKEQKETINKTIGVCRFIYNFFIARNKETYEKEKKFVNGYNFSKWLNNEFLVNNSEYSWIKDVSSKSVKQSIMNAEQSFKRFFKKQSGFPKFKKKNKSDVKMYFVKTDAKTKINCERHKIKVPTLGWIRIKEKGYIPTNQIIKCGTISKKADRYYISVLIEVPDVITNKQEYTEGLGIDLGLNNFVVISNGITKKNINKTSKIKKVEKKLKREQRKLSRKYESLKRRKKDLNSSVTRETELKEEATRQNIQKEVIKVQKLHQKLETKRTDYINKIVNDLVKTKPSYITIEDLNVSGMMKNRHLSKAVSNQKFYEFRIKLENKCKQNGIELRIVDRFYPSSKLCHNCGKIKSELKLSDRKYVCECGYEEDRDYNASLNLRDAKIYKIAQ